MQFVPSEDLVGEARLEINLLSELFADSGLANLRRRYPGHQAVRIHDLLEPMTRPVRTGIPFGERHLVVEALARCMIDRSTWAHGVIGSGMLDRALADPATVTKVRTRVRDQFDDVMAELYVWGWMRARGWAVELTEDEGQPDLRVTSPLHVAAEVKRVHKGSPKRIAKIVTKANKQLGAANGEHGGVLFILLARQGGRASLGDRLPSDVSPYVEELGRSLTAVKHRSVSAAVIAWDELRIISDRPGKHLVAVTRHSRVFRHPAPRLAPPEKLLADQLDNTVAVQLTYPRPSRGSLPGTRVGEVEVGGGFRDMNEFELGLVAEEVAEIAADPDHSVHVDAGGSQIVLMTRRVPLDATHDYVVVMLASDVGVQGFRVETALQLFGDPAEIQAWTADARLAYTTAVERYGQIIATEDGQRAYLIEHCRGGYSVDRPSAGTVVALLDWSQAAFGLADVTHRFLSVIDRDRHQAEVWRHRRLQQ